MVDEAVKVMVRFKPAEDLPGSEGLWAVRLDGHEAGGTFRLDNSSFMVPLAAGDVVRAELDGDGLWQVTDFVEACGSVLTCVRIDADACDVQAVIDRWTDAGAEWSEGYGGTMVTTWRPGMTDDEVGAALAPDLTAGYAEWLTVNSPAQRTREALDEVDFDLDSVQHFPPVETSYWAADDPFWASVGRDDPEFLASVQRLASEQKRVARALERGQQDRVLFYIDRMNEPDPSMRPKLDGPIFDPE